MIALLLIFLLGITSSCRTNESEDEPYQIIESPIISNDISNQQIKAFGEDEKGHIWIGTFRGLNKFNVHEYHQYFCMDDSTDLPDNQINDIFRDSQKRLWIVTVNGVCRYTDKDNFERIPIGIQNQNGYQLLENTEGKIFLNMVSHLSVYNPDTEQFDTPIVDFDTQRTFIQRCYIDKENALWAVCPVALRRYNSTTLELLDSIPTNGYYTYSYMSDEGNVWLTGQGTITVFDMRSREFIDAPEVIRRHPVLSKATIELIHDYGNNSLLMSTANQGIFLYDYIQNTVVHQDDNGFPFQVPDFKITKMFTDSQKNLWLGSVDQGYAVSYHYKKRFNNNNYLCSYLEKKSVVSVAADKERNLWITTLMDGVYVYSFSKQEMEKFDMKILFPHETSKIPAVNQVFVDNSNYIWMTATSNEALKCRYVDGLLKVESRYPILLPMSITQDANQTIWIGTASPYVYSLRLGEKDFQAKQVFPLMFTFIPGLLSLSDGNILAASFHCPMKLINSDTGEILDLDIPEEDINNCIRRSVFIPTALHEDTQGEVWIGTVSNGLMRYSPSTQRMIPIQGTACLDISGIEEDAQGNLWVSTQYGLSKYDRTVEKFTNYYAADGIGGNQFYDRSSCRLTDGMLVFGGTHGLTFFNPVDVPMKRNIPLLFEDLKIHNKLVRPQDVQCINKHLSYRPDIRLEHDQNGFSISYAALDYSEYERVHYYYMLEGFDKYWVDAHNNREAYYANLPAGTYTFKVKITNNDQSIIEAENSIRVIVLPAPWATWWAYCIYFIVAAGIITLFVSAWQSVRTEKALALQAEREKAQEQQVNRMNMSFFANISHEFRTPLTMISSPITQLCNNPEIVGENKKLLYIVQRSVNRMLKLVNQIMDFNKLENDTLKLKVKRMDIIVLLRRIVDVFEVNTKNKNIALKTFGLEDTFLLWLDEDKIDKIFGNLMSNALKFTPVGGTVHISLDVINREEAAQLFTLRDTDRETQYIKISVSNTGDNIPEDKLEKIFERYYQLNNQTDGTYNWGTGIGLYYARSLAELHHGYIKASKPVTGSGAEFTFILPVNDISYTEEEQAQEQRNQPEAFPLPGKVLYQSEEMLGNTKEHKTILVVDDDAEIAHYLKILLSLHYKVVCRFDANSALQAMKEEAPDLIISDIVMPGKDGHQLCREIKEDLQLCHIPVIMVTARATVEDQVEGLDTGADAYVTKPFEPNYLLALIKSQLKNREKVRNILGKATQTDKLEKNILSPQDNAFMTDLYRLMENELGNPELDIARMTQLLKISRTKFYYKVKGLTGENPSFFFKTYKLNRAAELLSEGKYNISEVADMTGFSTLSHFSSSFKKQFGVTPKEYYC